MEGKKSVGYSFSPVAIDGRRRDGAAATGSLSRGEGGKNCVAFSPPSKCLISIGGARERGSIIFSPPPWHPHRLSDVCVWIRGAIMRLIPALPVFLALAGGGANGRVEGGDYY